MIFAGWGGKAHSLFSLKRLFFMLSWFYRVPPRLRKNVAPWAAEKPQQNQAKSSTQPTQNNPALVLLARYHNEGGGDDNKTIKRRRHHRLVLPILFIIYLGNLERRRRRRRRRREMLDIILCLIKLNVRKVALCFGGCRVLVCLRVIHSLYYCGFHGAPTVGIQLAGELLY